MMRAFRKYHRALAIIVSLPLILTVLSGMGYTVFDEYLGMEGAAEKMIQLHTMEFLGLGKIYPILNGIGLVGMLATGISMTSLFRKSRSAADKSTGS
jgi:hypothetical protein